MGNKRGGYYWRHRRAGQVAALKGVILWCGRQLSSIPVTEHKFSSFCDVINFCGKAREVILAGGTFVTTGQNSFIVRRYQRKI